MWILLTVAMLAASALESPAQQSPQVYAFNAASFQPGLTTGIVSIFPGSITPFATSTAIAGVTPLPVELLGTQVRIDGDAAPLFFVSPAQINLLVSERFAGRTVNLEVLRAGNPIYHQVLVVSPGFGAFTANARGFGAPAGLLYLPAFARYDPVTDASLQPRPLAVSTAGRQNYLILYTTGLSSRAVTAVIDGLEYPVSFSGGVQGLAGVEQINIPLAPGLVDKGIVSVVLRSGSQWANAVLVCF